jgi:cold shock CspA family protein
MRGGFGFIKPVANPQKSYFFRARDVEGKSTQLQAGDSVDFFLAPDPKNPMDHMAVSVRLLGSNDALSNITFGGAIFIFEYCAVQKYGVRKKKFC